MALWASLCGVGGLLSGAGAYSSHQKAKSLREESASVLASAFTSEQPSGLWRILQYTTQSDHDCVLARLYGQYAHSETHWAPVPTVSVGKMATSLAKGDGHGMLGSFDVQLQPVQSAPTIQFSRVPQKEWWTVPPKPNLIASAGCPYYLFPDLVAAVTHEGSGTEIALKRTQCGLAPDPSLNNLGTYRLSVWQIAAGKPVFLWGKRYGENFIYDTVATDPVLLTDRYYKPKIATAEDDRNMAALCSVICFAGCAYFGLSS